MSIQETIKRAIEGGYKIPAKIEAWDIDLEEALRFYVLDPLFWQALGKAMGWKGNFSFIQKDPDWSDNKGIEKGQRKVIIPFWLYYWHRFIDHLAKERYCPRCYFNKGHSIESFFEKLK